jgi:hypothetical protein
MVQLEDLISGKPISAARFRGAAQHSTYESRLLNAAKERIGSKASVVEPEALPDTAVGASSNLQGLSSRLARGNITDEAREDLARLATLNDQQLILVQFMRVKVGPGGWWNPNSGQIASAAHSTLLQSALISCKDGRVIWKSEQFLRKALEPDSNELGKVLTLLYETLDIK